MVSRPKISTILSGMALFLGALLLAPPAAAQQKTVPRDETTPPAGSRKVPAMTPPDLSGSWAQLQVHASLSKVPVVGDIRSTTTSLLLMDIEQKGARLSMDVRACDVTIDSDVKQIVTDVPQAMVDALGLMKLEARLAPGNEFWRFEQKRNVSVLGAKLKNPDADSLPTWARDYRVEDSDDDGKPGVTVRITGIIDGAIYLVQRSITRLRGLVRSSDRVRGQVEWTTEQSILGATSRLLESQPGTRPDPNVKRSHFEMRRVQPGMTCGELRKRSGSLFSR